MSPSRSNVKDGAATDRRDEPVREPRPQQPNQRSVAAAMHAQAMLAVKRFKVVEDWDGLRRMERVRDELWEIAWGGH